MKKVPYRGRVTVWPSPSVPCGLGYLVSNFRVRPGLDVVRNGEQKYQGTYVDFETGCRLCVIYGLSELQKQLQIEIQVDWSYRRCRRWLLSVYHVSASESVVSRREDCTNIHGNVDVHSLGLPLRPDKCKKNLELLDTPAKHLRKYPQTKPTQTFIHATVKIDSGLAKALVLWPRAEGHFEGDDVHVDEACFFHLALHNFGVATSGHTHGLDTLFPEPLPLLKGTVRGHAAVIRGPVEVELLIFDPA